MIFNYTFSIPFRLFAAPISIKTVSLIISGAFAPKTRKPYDSRDTEIVFLE